MSNQYKIIWKRPSTLCPTNKCSGWCVRLWQDPEDENEIAPPNPHAKAGESTP